MRGFLSVNIQSLLAPIPAKALFHNIHFVGNLNIIFHIVFCRQIAYIHIGGRILLSVTRQWPQVANALHLLTLFRKLCRLISALEVPWVGGENGISLNRFPNQITFLGYPPLWDIHLSDIARWISVLVTGDLSWPSNWSPRILHRLFEANHWMITSCIILWVKTCKYQGDWGSININLIAWYPMFCFVPEWVFKGTHNIGW